MPQGSESTACPFSGLTRDAGYTANQIVILTPLDGRSVPVVDAINNLHFSISTYSSVVRPSTHVEYASFVVLVSPSTECEAFRSIQMASSNVSGACYFNAPLRLSCFLMSGQTLEFESSLGSLDRDSDTIPDVIDNCADTSNPDQARTNPNDVLGSACPPPTNP